MAHKIISKDFPENSTLDIMFGNVFVSSPSGWSKKPEMVNIKNIEQVTEENKRNFISTAAFGAAGAVLLGPIGLAAGLLSSKKTEVTFIAECDDNKVFMATVPLKVYNQLLAKSKGLA